MGSEGITALYGEVIGNLEKEVLDRFDITGDREVEKYVGRALVPEFALSLVVAVPTVTSHTGFIPA